MSNIKNYITFLADFPDDSKYILEDNVKMGAGKNIAEALVSLFNEAEYETDTIDEYDNYGWEFQVSKNGSWFWCLIQNAEPWLCITESRSISIPFINRKSVNQKLTIFVSDFQKILEKDSRFSSIQSFTKKEFEVFRNNL